MTIDPPFETFRARYEAGEAQLVAATRVGDLDTPVGALLKLGPDAPNTFLFESIEHERSRGRYSIIGLDPDLIWRCRGGRAEVNPRADEDARAFVPDPGPPLAGLRRLIAASRLAVPAGLPPMSAGLFGYMAYDMVREMERLPAAKSDPLGVPDALFVRPRLVIIFDSVKDEITLVTPVFPNPRIGASAAYEAAGARIGTATARLDQPLPASAQGTAPGAGPTPPAPRSNTTREGYHAMVEQAKAYIRAGDAFQIVPSQRFALPFSAPPVAFYRALRRINPSPYLFYLNFEGFSVVGSSPEILVRLRDGTVTIRPVAGTRPRGRDSAEDLALEQDLLADPKERAEHLMLLDLGRNDVGRVAEIGSVKVTASFTIERYSHVMHIVSNVEGRLKAGEDALSALIAGFPAGTVSGAPKVRAMEIINELESEKRGVYAGAVGYFAANGAMDTCIALRTAVIKDGTLYVQAGGGVVADSDPETEYQETVNKAKALMRAAAEAYRFAPPGDEAGPRPRSPGAP